MISQILSNSEIGFATIEAYRVGYALCMLGTLLNIIIYSPKCLLSKSWQGFAQDVPIVKILHNPFGLLVASLVWGASLAALLFKVQVILAALVNFTLCRYYFHSVKHYSKARGFGALGFFCAWGAGALLLLEISVNSPGASSGWLVPWVTFVLQADLALILINAGITKLKKSYWRTSGLEYSLVHPNYSRFSKSFLKFRPDAPVFAILNHACWILEIAAGCCMLVPQLKMVGAALLVSIFSFVLINFRFLALAPLMCLNALLFLPADSWLEKLFGLVWKPEVSTQIVFPFTLEIFPAALWAGLIVYLALLVPAHALGFIRPSKGSTLNRWLLRYAELFDIGRWDVFTNADQEPVVFVNEFPQSADNVRSWTNPASHSLSLGYSIVSGEIFKSDAFGSTELSADLASFVAAVKKFPDSVVRIEAARVVIEKDRFNYLPVLTVDLKNNELICRVQDQSTRRRAVSSSHDLKGAAGAA